MADLSAAAPLTSVDLVIASALVMIAGGVSLSLRLKLGGELAVASVRTVVQLTLIGYLLQWIFDLQSAPAVLAWVGIMIVAAGRAATRRVQRTFDGSLVAAVGTLSLTALLTTFTVTAAVIRVDPWFDPQYVIPLCGMVLGNTMTGLSLCLDSILESFDDGRAEIEVRLLLGATSWQAGLPAVRKGVRRGMVPILNSMTVVGIVSLPGMMTGQILAGADPLEAVKYQIVVMFMIAAAIAIAVTIAIMQITRREQFEEVG